MTKVSGKFYWTETRMEGVTNGKEVYGVVSLPRYADSTTVEVYLNGQRLRPIGFTILGDPRFSLKDLTKYENLNKEYQKKYRMYHTTKVRVKYKEKQMELGKDIYNTVKGIRSYVTDLKTLSEILDARCIHRRVYPNEYLNTFYYYHFIFDQFGQVMVQNGESCHTFGSIPNHKSKCPICGKGWIIEDLTKGYKNFDYIYKNGEEYHKTCLYEKEKKINFTKVFGDKK